MVFVFLLDFFFFFFCLLFVVGRVKDDLAVVVDAEMVEKQPLGTAFVKVGRGLLEQRVDGELELELLDL